MGFFSHLSHFFHKVEHGIVHAAEGVVHTVTHEVEKAVKEVRHVISDGARIVGKIEHVLGAPLRYVVGGIAHLLGDLTGIHMRSLTQTERAVLQPIFVGTIPLDRILITSISGKDGRAFTVPGSMALTVSALIPVIGPLIALGGIVEHLQDKYLINVGGAAYKLKDLTVTTAYDASFGEKAGSELVHESTHVWQGHNGFFSWAYVFNSLYNQIKCGSHAYDVDFNHLHAWDDYNVEQQAHIVEQWYTKGGQQTDPLYPFIRDVIRKGRAHKPALPVPGLKPGLLHTLHH